MASEQLLVRLLMDSSQYNRAARSAATATGSVATSAKVAGAETSGLNRTIGNTGITMKTALVGGAVVAGAALVKFGKDSVQAFIGFEDALNQSLAIMGDVSDVMKGEMSDAAREIGKTTRLSATEAAESFFFLASAGLDAEQSIAALPQVAAFAQAGMFDMATATDLATDAQSALGLTVDDAGQNLKNLTRVTDVFVKANSSANTSVQQIAEAFTNKVGAALRGLNKDVEEGAAVLSAFADQGVKGAEAGTQFTIVLRDLQTKALANRDAFKEANVAVFDSTGTMRNLADIIGDLEGALEGMSDAGKKATLLGLGFSDKSVAAITNLLGTSEAIREYERAYRSATGEAMTVANKQLDSMAGKLALLDGRWEDLKIRLGEQVVPVVSDLALKTTSLFDVLDSDIDLGWTQRLSAGMQLVLGKSAEAVESYIEQKSTINELGVASVDAFGDIRGAAVGLTGPLSDVASGVGELGDEFGDVVVPAEDAEDGIEGVGDAAEETGKKTKTAAEAMRDLISAFLESANPIFAASKALERYQQAQDDLVKVEKDRKATAEDVAQAQLDVAQAALEAQGALEGLGGGALDQGLSAIASALGVSVQEAEKLLQVLGLLDGKKVTTVVDTRFVQSGTSYTAPTKSGTGLVQFRHSGGPGVAGSPYVMRPDEEIFVPSGNGQFLLNDQVMSALRGISTTHNNATNITIPSSGNTNTDAQLVGAVASVLRRMETL